MGGPEGHDPVLGSGGCDQACEDVRQECEGADVGRGALQGEQLAEADVDSYLGRIDLSSLSPRQRARFEIEARDQQRFTEEAKAALAGSCFSATALKDERLSRHTALGVGGPADAFIVIDDTAMLKEVLEFADARDVPLMAIGRASRLIVRDGGVRGIVIKLGERFEAIELSSEDSEFAYLKVGAATTCAALEHFAAERGFAGLECFHGDGGTVGGRFASRPHECASCIEELTVVDRSGRELSYRRKALVVGDAVRFNRSSVITALMLKARRVDGGSNAVADQDMRLREGLVGRIGGVFGNVGAQSAAPIIADAGLAGIRIGRIRLCEDDANMLINEGGGTARDAQILIGLVKDRVKQSAGISLDLKIGFVGDA